MIEKGRMQPDFQLKLESFYPGLYMIGYGKGKIILKFPPFFRLNEEYQEWEIQNQMKTKMFLFSFDVLNFPALDFPCSICRKAGILK